MNRLGLTGLHALPMHRRWVDFERHAMPLRNLDPAMEGFTLVQISDLHYSPVVWKRYLSQYLHWVNDLKPDLVVVTGDLITGGYRYAERAARLLEALDASTAWSAPLATTTTASTASAAPPRRRGGGHFWPTR